MINRQNLLPIAAALALTACEDTAYEYAFIQDEPTCEQAADPIDPEIRSCILRILDATEPFAHGCDFISGNCEEERISLAFTNNGENDEEHVTFCLADVPIFDGDVYRAPEFIQCVSLNVYGGLYCSVAVRDNFSVLEFFRNPQPSSYTEIQLSELPSDECFDSSTLAQELVEDFSYFYDPANSL